MKRYLIQGAPIKQGCQGFRWWRKLEWDSCGEESNVSIRCVFSTVRMLALAAEERGLYKQGEGRNVKNAMILMISVSRWGRLPKVVRSSLFISG